MEGSAGPAVPAKNTAYFLWELEGKAVTILVDLGVIEKIRAQASMALASLPGHGMEAGGVLLGRVEQLPRSRYLVTIESARPIESDPSKGPLLRLSEEQRQELERVIAETKDLEVLGWYRSTIQESNTLDQDDVALFDTYFPQPYAVFLLVRPALDGSAVARFHLRNDGELEIASPLGSFPFARRALRDGGYPVLRSAVSIAEIENFRPRLPAPKRDNGQWIVAGLAAAVLLTAAFLFRSKTEQTGSFLVTQYGEPAPLRLKVDRTGDKLQVTWDTQSKIITTAKAGILWIEDGAAESRFDLDGNQLRAGGASYKPLNRQVRFRLEVNSDTARITTEPLHAFLEKSDRKGEADLVAASNQDQTRARTADHPKEKPGRKKPVRRANLDAREHERVQTAALPQTIEPEQLQLYTQPVVPIPATIIPGSEVKPIASVSVEPVREASIRRKIQSLPMHILQRNSFKDTDRSSPARVVKSMNPFTPIPLKSEVKVDVRLSIDEGGHVTKTELMSTGANPQLAAAATHAAGYWQFEPAKADGKPIASKVILHFRFR